MHIAVMQENLELVRKFALIKPDQCMIQNHEGKSPFFLAVEKENYEIVTDIFAEFKLDAVIQRDALGENLLFVCARNGNEKIFRYFMGTNEYFIARGQ